MAELHRLRSAKHSKDLRELAVSGACAAETTQLQGQFYPLRRVFPLSSMWKQASFSSVRMSQGFIQVGQSVEQSPRQLPVVLCLL